jgi:hypothetical protein
MPTKGGKIKSSTQEYLEIAEIKGDTVLMRDGTMRSILMVSSVNFALKSEDEQNAVIANYVSFLNNINFTIQIVIQSRELNIDNYLETLKQKEKEQTNELLKIQMQDYIKYISELISIGKIMSKRFYLLVPYNPMTEKHRGFFRSLLDAFKPAFLIKMKEEKFIKYRQQLDKRVELVKNSLAAMGLMAVQLDTQSIIELFYNTYNPVASKHQTLADVKQLRINE